MRILDCALLTSWLVLQGACQCSDPPEPKHDASADISGLYSASVDQAPPVPPQPSSAWAVVESMTDVEGRWGAKENTDGPYVIFRSRAAAQKNGTPWGLPYPWHMELRAVHGAKPYDCGLYENITEDASDDWRVGFCQGAVLTPGERQALRISLYLKPTEMDAVTQLRVRIGSQAEIEVAR